MPRVSPRHHRTALNPFQARPIPAQSFHPVQRSPVPATTLDMCAAKRGFWVWAHAQSPRIACDRMVCRYILFMPAVLPKHNYSLACVQSAGPPPPPPPPRRPRCRGVKLRGEAGVTPIEGRGQGTIVCPAKRRRPSVQLSTARHAILFLISIFCAFVPFAFFCYSVPNFLPCCGFMTVGRECGGSLSI